MDLAFECFCNIVYHMESKHTTLMFLEDFAL